MSKVLDKNIAMFKEIFQGDDTFTIREFDNKWLDSARCCIIYFDGMVKNEIINANILQPVLRNDLTREIKTGNLLEELQKKVLNAHGVEIQANMKKILDSVTYGDTIFLVDHYDKALIINTKGWISRSIAEPESERVVRGPREGFTESILTNISLIRRRIRNTDLKIHYRELGVQTHTKICLCYLNALVLPNILKELQSRLDKIEIDSIIDSGYIQELIRDAPFSPFETVGYSERPDVVAARMLEGRIAIIVDGSPCVLTVPFVMAEVLQSNEDYYTNYIFSSFNRFMRAASSTLSIGVPAIFLSLVTFHQEMLPTSLLMSLTAARKGVPIPTVLSIFIMLLIFDALREAGTRMPSAIGQAVNIVGTLVLGQAAVEAKLVSAPVIIVTALSGILTLMNLNMIGAVIILRSLLLILAGVLGIYGYILGMIVVILHLMSIRSFGVPYMLGLSRIRNHDGQDGMIRAPWWTMTLRPKIMGARNLVRQHEKAKRR